MPAQPHDLVIDIGNTRTKTALFMEGRMLSRGTFENGDVASLKAFIGLKPVGRIAIGSVATDHPSFLVELEDIAPVTVITGSMPGPLRNVYASPATLGVDRWANAVGAAQLLPQRAVLAIDLGTCITYDVVTADGRYLGGAIAPGLRMRAKAMHAFSARLPEAELNDGVELVGNDTLTSLASGVHHGVVHEVEGWIRHVGYQYADLAVVLTGGDAIRIARALEKGIFALPSLTLLGLYALLAHKDPRDMPVARG